MTDSAHPTPVPPSGQQFELRHGDQRVVVTEVGAGLREYTVDGRPVLDGYGVDQQCSSGRGQTLIPWPNRIDGGRYPAPGSGAQQKLALTEPGAGNAIHGLTRWANWTCAAAGGSEGGAAELRMTLTVHAQQGWPFVLACELRYTLDDGGLAVRTTARNVGAEPCPYATGAHPYLTVGTELVDEVVVHAAADRYLPVDSRGIPTGVEPVEGTPYDLIRPVGLGGRVLDTAYTDLLREPDGLARTQLAAPDGWSVTLWQDAEYGYRQLFTGDTLAPDRRRRGLAVEPMTAPPNAFRTGEALRVLAPGESHQATWGITPG